jgi:YHS domain-containing protein
MSNRNLIRKMLFAASLTMSTGIGATAFAYQQYQPGEPGKQIPQGNTTVTQELNRMFQESGQTIPSMNTQDLPNGNVATGGQVRLQQPQKQPTNQNVNRPQQSATIHGTNQSQNRPAQQNSAQTGQASPPAKPGILGRFFGKFRGDSAGNNPNYKPPVPPDYNASAPKTVANSNTNQPAAVRSTAPVPPVTRPATIVQLTTGQVAQNSAGTPQGNQPSPTSNQSATAQAYHGNKPQSTQSENASAVRNGAMSVIPLRSGSSVQPVNRPNNGNAASAANGNRPEYTQPGSAPGFMATANSTAVILKHAAAAPQSADKFSKDFQQEDLNGAAARGTTQNQMRQPAAAAAAATVAVKEAADAFDSPFLDVADSSAESDILDLDSLIDIPRGQAEPDRTAAVETIRSAPQVEESTAAESAGEEGSPESTLGPDENPFTGIQLNTSDAEFFGGAEPAAPASGDSIPLTPMEDFNADLPAMDLSLDGTQTVDLPTVDLPAVDLPAVDLPSVDLPSVDLPSVDLPSVDLPAVDEASPEFAQPNPKPASLNSPESDLALPAEADTTGRAELTASPDVPPAMSEAEIEQLRQMAEQERRKQQKRLIQSRTGQTGFKGFCPVALRERRELLEANDQFTSTFGLQTYTFSSAESKAAFDAEPSRYAPAAGGSDVVVLVNSGEEQTGQLDYALWYRDRLYLFRSRETMTLFSRDPQRFASQY